MGEFNLLFPLFNDTCCFSKIMWAVYYYELSAYTGWQLDPFTKDSDEFHRIRYQERVERIHMDAQDPHTHFFSDYVAPMQWGSRKN